MTIALLIVALLTAVYALTLASVAPYDLLMGALLGGSLLWLTRRSVMPVARPGVGVVLRRSVALVPFAFIILREIAVGTWRVSLIVIGARRLRAPGIVKVPIGERTPSGVVASSLAETLSPGSVLIDIDWDDRALYFHLIDASDPDAVRNQSQRIYERYQRHVFP